MEVMLFEIVEENGVSVTESWEGYAELTSCGTSPITSTVVIDS